MRVRDESLALFGGVEYVLQWADEFYQQVVLGCLAPGLKLRTVLIGLVSVSFHPHAPATSHPLPHTRRALP